MPRTKKVVPAADVPDTPEQQASTQETQPRIQPSVNVILRPAEEAPDYAEWKAEQERVAEQRTRELEKMRDAAAADVTTLLQRFIEHGFASEIELRLWQSQTLVPLSAELLLMALIEEGRLDRVEMQARQLVIQAKLLNVEFQKRCIRHDEQALSSSSSASASKPRTSGLVLPNSVRSGKRIVTAD